MIQVDLHGLTLAEAKARVRSAIESALTRKGPQTLRIITGKGLHSRDDSYGGGVLAKEIHGFVKSTYGKFIRKIQDSPHDVALDGVPIRGHFDVEVSR